MRWQNSAPAALMLAASAVALWPAIAQRAPESILPPGFGQPEPPPPASPKGPDRSDRPDRPPPDLVPDVALKPPTDAPTTDVIGDLIEGVTNNSMAVVAAPVDLPPAARRSLDRVGLLAPEDGGFAPTAFGNTNGRFLGALMAGTRAPMASRWLQVVVRRALLSPTDIPQGTNGADWVAERAWLLVRMGEADMARALVARVDSENYTPRLYEVAMQAALATGDPAALCPIADAASDQSDKPAWPLAQAMCAGLAGESGTASAIVDRVRDNREAGGIDVLLAEKVVGAATNTRRSVSIQWDGVERLTAWRYGLATATGVAIPERLFGTAGPQVLAWQARAPLLPLASRVAAAERACALGVLSSSALVDFYGALWDASDPADRGGSPAEQLRAAFSADGTAARLSAMRSLWDSASADPYARSVLTARAAAELPVSDEVSGADLDRLIASMLTAGLDIQAARWSGKVSRGSLGWALLALGAPRGIGALDAAAIGAIDGGEEDRRARVFLAGLAGLGRLSTDEINGAAQRYQVAIGRASNWTRAIDAAAAAGEAGTVLVLAAAGMQTPDWRNVPPEHLYHIVAALRRVGLEPEARMIAAEALARV